MAGLNNVLDEVCITINNILTANNAGLSMGTYAPEGNKNAVMAGGAKEESCVCGACVMCKNATVDSVPVHILKDGKKVFFPLEQVYIGDSFLVRDVSCYHLLHAL